jgi:hypothetical protein
MRQQTTPNILMVRPANFAFNTETAENNAFQSRDGLLSESEMRARAMSEFDGFVQKLRSAGVHIIVAQDSDLPVKPDAVFPNNWVTFHQENMRVTWPMFAENRRLERQENVLKTVEKAGFLHKNHLDLSENEQSGVFLEGTGSIIFDHENQLAYACLSPRTDGDLLENFCQKIGYSAILFRAVDAGGQEIYHTNVMMALGETFVVICLDSVPDADERNQIVETFESTNKDIVEISFDQMNQFAGNMLQVQNTDGERILVMSETAFKALLPDQIEQLESHTTLLFGSIPTIENYGGGSARCMMAEIF